MDRQTDRRRRRERERERGRKKETDIQADRPNSLISCTGERERGRKRIDRHNFIKIVMSKIIVTQTVYPSLVL